MKSLIRFKSVAVIMLSLFFTLMSVSNVAEAKRFGMGKSFGFSKQIAPKQYSTPKAAPAKSAKSAGTAGRPASGASKWLGPLAGLAAGGLLAAMLFGDGFDGISFFDILMFALIAFVLFKLFARKKQGHAQGHYQSAYDGNQSHSQSGMESQHQAYRQSQQPIHESATPSSSGSIIGADLDDGMGQGVSGNAQFLSEIPAWFDEQGFVEGAKSHFVTLQKAWDNVDLSEIESYCTPELFSELQQELRGVQAGDNQTVVDTLDAEIAAMAVDGEFFIVSVRFTGFIQEDAVKGAHAFNEIWHIRRLAKDEGNWLVAGIQQTNDMQ